MVPPSAMLTGRLFGDGGEDTIAQLGDLIQFATQARQALTSQSGGMRHQLRHQRERSSQRQQLARPGGSQRQLRGEPLEIENARQHLAHLRARDGGSQGFLHRVEPLLDLFTIHARPQQTLAQQSAAHAGAGLDPAR